MLVVVVVLHCVGNPFLVSHVIDIQGSNSKLLFSKNNWLKHSKIN